MTTLEKYIWVVNALYKKGERGLSLKELNDKWMRNENISNGEPLPRQTFDRWKGNILKSYFSTFYGIVTDEKVPIQRIVVRAKKQHQHYLRSLPLHPTQKEIFTCGEYADFELTLRPTYDFIMELLHVGNMIEVLEPESLRQAMKGWVSDLWELYEHD